MNKKVKKIRESTKTKFSSQSPLLNRLPIKHKINHIYSLMRDLFVFNAINAHTRQELQVVMVDNFVVSSA